MRGRRLLVLATVGLTVIGWASPALAKGATEATITGPGLEKPVVLDFSGPSGGHWLSKLADGSGLYVAIFGGPADGLLDDPPTDDLGPKYEIAYRIPGSNAPDEVVRQDLYPLASVGPLTYTAPGQVVYDAPSRGGWYRGRAAFAELLDGLGIPVSPVQAPPAAQPAAPAGVQAPAAPAAPAAVDASVAAPAGSAWVGIAVAAGGALFLLAAAFGWRSWRRLHPRVS